MSQKIEVREVDDFFDEPQHCPFCGQNPWNSTMKGPATN